MLLLGKMASVAELEAGLISERTKVADGSEGERDEARQSEGARCATWQAGWQRKRLSDQV